MIVTTNWIKMGIGLIGDIRVKRMAKRLKKSPQHVLGALFVFWAIADQHASDDGVVPYTPEEINKEVGIKNFVDALPPEWCEPITTNDSMTFVVLPKYHEHNGSTTKARLEHSRRVNRSRNSDTAESASQPPTEPDSPACSESEQTSQSPRTTVTHAAHTCDTSSAQTAHTSATLELELERELEEEDKTPHTPQGGAADAAESESPQPKAFTVEQQSLLDSLIETWHEIHASGLALSDRCVGGPTKAVLDGWRRVWRDPEARGVLRSALAMQSGVTSPMRAALEKARFCHREPWFELTWLFGKADKMNFNFVGILRGKYDNARSNRSGDKPVGQYFDPNRVYERLG